MSAQKIIVEHGCTWCDASQDAPVKKAYCTVHSIWHEQHEVTPECGLGRVSFEISGLDLAAFVNMKCRIHGHEMAPWPAAAFGEIETQCVNCKAYVTVTCTDEGKYLAYGNAIRESCKCRHQ